MNTNRLKGVSLYEISLGVLAILSVALLIIQERAEISLDQEQVLDGIDFLIWGIFASDYFYHLVFSRDRKVYVKNHIIELVAILPFNALFKGIRAFRLFRFVRISLSPHSVRFVRLIAYFGRTHNYLSRFLKYHHFQYVLFITASVVILGAVAIRNFENMDFYDALWWSFVTATTVGYGDIAPTTMGGRIIATILMLVGIGFISILTGTIASYFISPKQEEERNSKQEFVTLALSRLEKFDNLTLPEVQDICRVLVSLKSEESAGGEK
ncbi:potassium channel family protein [Aminobacterium sp. MB27-C1]|jgi:voltage-gated potassium channel|nr:potassium channel family protein [Aminobacterium sp. MB27-C1]MDD2206855.1 potassium channel family protein [Aminobacterium sp.]WMI72203.1 potassium channel family protein [Aminobacterium sp. MB27-C1]